MKIILNSNTTASLEKARRGNVIAALNARSQWHTLAAMGFHWLCDEPRRLMRAKLKAARLYKVAQ